MNIRQQKSASKRQGNSRGVTVLNNIMIEKETEMQKASGPKDKVQSIHD